MIGIPESHACSTAGVSVSVVFGETISASQSPERTSDWMSEICLSSEASASTASKLAMSSLSASTCACIVVHPTTRHGLSTAAFEKQMFHGPGVLYCDVSTSLGSIACTHGSFPAP